MSKVVQLPYVKISIPNEWSYSAESESSSAYTAADFLGKSSSLGQISANNYNKGTIKRISQIKDKSYSMLCDISIYHATIAVGSD